MREYRYENIKSRYKKFNDILLSVKLEVRTENSSNSLIENLKEFEMFSSVK
ncbi:MAG: hypothetical protein ACI87N_002765 [Flavobacteriales bacterium]|jgi:hypothetical protein